MLSSKTEKDLVEKILLGDDLSWKKFIDTYSRTLIILSSFEWCQKRCPNNKKDIEKPPYDCYLKCIDLKSCYNNSEELNKNLENKNKNVFYNLKMNRDLIKDAIYCDDSTDIFDFALEYLKLGLKKKKATEDNQIFERSQPRLKNFLSSNFRLDLNCFIKVSFIKNIIPDYKKYRYEESGEKDKRYKPSKIYKQEKNNIYIPSVLRDLATEEELVVFEVIVLSACNTFEMLLLETDKLGLEFDIKDLQNIYNSLRKKLGKNSYKYLDRIMLNNYNLSLDFEESTEEEKPNFEPNVLEKSYQEVENNEFRDAFKKVIDSFYYSTDKEELLYYKLIDLRFNQGLSLKEIAEKMKYFDLNDTSKVNNKLNNALRKIQEKLKEIYPKKDWLNFIHELENDD